jgi:hypothetical protein
MYYGAPSELAEPALGWPSAILFQGTPSDSVCSRQKPFSDSIPNLMDSCFQGEKEPVYLLWLG